MSKLQYPFSIPIQMRWKDVDQVGHVNNTKLLTYMEEARIRLLEEELKWDYRKTGIVVVRMEADYVKPLLYPNKIAVRIACTRIGNTSMDVHQLVTSLEDENDIYVSGKVILVTINPQTGEPTMVPDIIRERMAPSQKIDRELG